MLEIDLEIIFVLAVVILAAWRIKKGFINGMVEEIVNILSVIVACICIALIFFVVSSIMARTFSVLTLCVTALIGIGFVFKLCSLIFKPITSILNISIISGLDKFLGAFFGLGEAIVLSSFLYFILNKAGIFSA